MQKNILDKTLHLFLQKLDLENKTIAIGYSGGADSTALLHLLNQKKDFFKFKLEAVFFSHSGSPIAEDSDFIQHVKKKCNDLQVKLHFNDLNMDKKIKKQSWESTGRLKRVDFYKNFNADYIFLGHHKDDQNETTMTQLFRGAGKAMTGMKKIDGKFYRPFLDLKKDDIYQFLKNQNISWYEDPANKDSHYTRIFWRNEGLPLLKKHYPDYSEKLDTFRDKLDSLQSLSKQLAIIDGLNDLNNNKSVTIENIGDERLKNLIQHFFNNKNISMEKKDWEMFFHSLPYKTNKKPFLYEKKAYTIHISQNMLSICPTIEIKNNFSNDLNHSKLKP